MKMFCTQTSFFWVVCLAGCYLSFCIETLTYKVNIEGIGPFRNHFTVEQRYPGPSTSIVFMKFYSKISQWWVHFYSCYVWWNGKHGNIVTRQPLQPHFFQTLNEGCRTATFDRLIFVEVAIFIARRWSYLGQKRNEEGQTLVSPGFVCMVWLKIYVVVLFLCCAIRYCIYIL